MLCNNCNALIVNYATQCSYCKRIVEGLRDNPQLRVLVVEDDEEIQALMRRWLSAAGLEISTVSNGRDALEVFAKESFDIAIIDMDIPFISGLEVSRSMKTTKPDFPVLLCTAYVKTLSQEQIEETRADGLVTKPINLDVLLLDIQRLTFGGLDSFD